MPETGKLRVLMATPVPPPFGGGILNWTQIVLNYLGKNTDLELRITDTKVRFRKALSLNRAKRLVSGTLQSIVDSYRLMKALRSFRPHVFHLCTSGGMATPKDILMLQIARLFGVPGVIHYHMGRLPWIFIRDGYLWKLTHRAMSLADAVVTLDRLSAITIQPELPKTRVVTLPNSVEIDDLDAIRPLGEDLRPEEHVRRIVYLGMVIPPKGICELVQACLKLQDRNIELELVGMVGKDFREELTNLASQGGGGKWLRFTGMVSHDRAMEHLAAADIFALPSYTEGAPNVILEAMAMERCIVATAVGAIPEMLDIDGPEECGICVPPRDVESLAEAIAKILDDPRRMREMGIRARARAKRLYDAPVACRQLVDLWKETAAARAAKYFRTDHPTTVMIVAPLPPPDHGGIVNWSRILRNAFSESPSWRLHFIDSTARYRAVTNLSFFVRLFGGTMNALKMWLTINKSIYRIRPQVVHVCTSGGLATPRNIVTLKIARHYGIPTVIHYRMGAIPKACAKNGTEWRWMLRAMRLADVVVTLDRRSEACVRECLPAKQVVTLPNMVDLDEIDGIRSSLDPLEARAEGFRVTFIGHVLPTKGIGELVEACAKLAGRGLQLDLVGPFEERYRAKLLASAASSGSADWLRFRGPQPHDEAVRFLALADVAALPSYTEGFPNAVLEAMALGKAILATSVGAIPEMLDIGGGEECGICVPPREVEPLECALERLMENPELRRELGAQARRRAERLYSVPAGCKQLTDLWSSVDSRDRPPQ